MKNKRNGFTLVEILISLGIIAILGAGFLGLQYIISQNQISAWRNYQNIEDSNTIVTSFIKEIRNARQSDNGAYVLDTTSDQEIIFYSDVDLDGKVDKVRYTLNNNKLIRGVTKPTGNPAQYLVANEKVRVLSQNARNLSQPVFTYYNEDWPTDTVNNPLDLADRIANTRIVKIYLRINTKTNDPDSDYILESESKIRMLNGT